MPCLSEQQQDSVSELTDMGFTLDQALLALVRSAWSTKLAAVLLRDGGRLAVTVENRDPASGASATSADGISLCSRGCGREARIRLCCRFCHGPDGPHAACCRGPAGGTSREARGTRSSAASAPAEPEAEDSATPATPTAAEAEPTQRGYVVLRAPRAETLGWHPVPWDVLERRLNFQQGYVAGRLRERRKVDLLACNNSSDAAMLWEERHPGTRMPTP